jgi:Gpi18-like mannosyltransferase
MKFSNKYIAPVVLLISAIVLIVLQWFSTGISGETDSVTHYQMARYAFKHPEYFLNHWGKPLFTILSSPLAQFGYTGAVAFNLICGLLSAWFAYLIAKRMDYRHAWVAIIFTLFTPLYLFIMFSSLTEILFSLVLISAIYLFISKRFIRAAIVISFIPFARTEGMMFIILFVPAFIWMKQYKSLPFLFTGFIVFSIVGWPFYHDLFWFFTQMPYGSSGSELYGSGSFWYYFRRLDGILYYPLLILSIT